jgi:DNA recombination protein RmuC
VFDLGRQLYDRISGLGGHVDRLGRTLAKAVTAYNQAVGSLESRVLPSARRLSELGVVSGEELTVPALVEEAPRGLSAPELVDSAPEPTPGLPDMSDRAPADGAGLDTADVDPAGLVRAVR